MDHRALSNHLKRRKAEELLREDDEAVAKKAQDAGGMGSGRVPVRIRKDEPL